MQLDHIPNDDGDVTSHIRLCSDEINILIYLYLVESNFTHTAFSLLAESSLSSTPLFQSFNPSYPTTSATSQRPPSSSRSANGASKPPPSSVFGSGNDKIPRGELVRKLWKALRWEEIERHVAPSNAESTSNCRSPFHLILPHACSDDDKSEPLASSPPLKRPEAFPPQPSSRPAITKASSSNSSPPERELDGPPPTVIGKGKRKGHTDSPPLAPKVSVVEVDGDPMASTSVSGPAAPALADDVQDWGHNSDSASVDLGPRHKRLRETNTKTSETTGKIKVSSRRTIDSSKGRSPSTEPNGGNWSEHRDAVTCLAWNPKDKEVLVTGSSDGTAKLWNFAEPKDRSSHALQLVKKPFSISHKSIDSGKKAVTALVWHPDGTVFATASDGVGRLFTPSGQLQGILTYGRGAINSLKFNPSGTSLLAAKDDFTVCLFVLDFDLKSPKQLSFESHTKEVNDVDWLDDDIFASGGNDHTIFIYRANDRRPRFTLKGHTDDVTRVKWSPPRPGSPAHDRLLASVSDDGSIMIWKLPHYPTDRGTASRSLSPSKQPREKEQSTDDFFQMTVSPGSEYCVNRLSVVSGGVENKRMNTLEWSPTCQDGRMIVAAGGQDSTVKLFDALSGECIHVLSGLESGTGSIAFSPLSPARPAGILAGGGWNGKLILWDVETGQCLKAHEIDEELERQSARDKPMMMAMAWRHDGQQLALGLHNKTLLTVYVGEFM